MQKKIPRFILFVVLLFCVVGSGSVHAQRRRSITVRLVSSLPRNSPWGRTLDRIAADWSRVTNGEVTLQVLHQYPGSDGEYLQKLKQNHIQAAVFTSLGLNVIAPEIMALSIPLFIQNNGELDAVLREVRPILDSRIEEQGFINLALVKAGWVNIFSRSPVRTPNDLRRLKLATSPDDEKLSDAFTSLGFKLVGVTMNDMVPFLNAGRIDAIYMSPIAVNTAQLYNLVNNMCTLPLAPFMGGVLMNKVTWDKIPQEYRPRLLEIIRGAGQEIENSFQKEERDAIANMRRVGVTINQPSPQEEQQWYQDLEERLPDMINRNIFNREMYERVKGILDDYRRRR